MPTLVAAFVTSFVIAFLTVPVLIKYSLRRNFVDLPGLRKIHTKVTPSLGGVAIFLGFALSTLIWIDFQHLHDIKFIVVGLFTIFFIGLRDDLVPLSPIVKLLGQIFVGLLIVFSMDLRVHSMEGMLGIHELPTAVSYGVTIFIIIIITNSFNLIDGIDGLAASLASVSLFAFSAWFFLNGYPLNALLGIAMLGGVLAFLIFNWEPAKVFMGDTGALLIGMTLSVQAIQFITINHGLPAGNPHHFVGGAAVAISFILVPLMDTLRVIILRLASGRSPMSPDKNHIHHNLIKLGLSHSRSTLLLVFLQIGAIIASVYFRWVSNGVLLIALAAATLIVTAVLHLLTRKSELPTGTISDSRSE
jgi:UDP-N-acetylmuramyl pentapeptide phosphotransferase/UDP-N-acetylglucosamine-1-phosphate transferase